MKDKININIDSDLLELARETIENFDMEIDSMVQEMLANVLGAKQIWVRTGTNEPLIPNTEISKPKEKKSKGRSPMFILKIWDRVKPFLNNEFTTDDYWDATKKADLRYRDSAKRNTILNHLKFLDDDKIIIKIEEKPAKYRKLEESPVIGTDKKDYTEEFEQN